VIEMAVEITIPRLGWNMDEGVFVAWLKQEGDEIKPGDMLFSLEGDKAVSEIESMDAGTLHFAPDAPRGGETVPVGRVVAYLLAKGEAPPSSPTSGAAFPHAFLPTPPMDRSDAPERSERRTGEAPPRESSAENGGFRVRATPRARRVAAELGVAWEALTGTGASGRIREADVRAAALVTPSDGPEVTRIPLTPLRNAIAAQMVAARQETVPVTLTTRVDATNLVNLREQFKAAGEEPLPSYNDLIVKLSALVLGRHPDVNARRDGDAILQFSAVHVGIAVDTEAGLVVPVIRDAGSLSLRAIAAKSRELIEKARRRRLSSEEMRGGTFTITNLGAFGIDAFTPVINVPECAILGIGAIRREAVPVEDRFDAREVMTLSLTFDHRVLDGAPAARFLATLRGYLENPAAKLVG
jgi:pyruvate dehydrogenase E2 component (dihydrolipoamide acetyltransferase)